ncbi:hypothetical protein K1719_034079 [Acacia pycnantha]|nr:hypothetical protein K1719_034079 [Acacia pycnantha]
MAPETGAPFDPRAFFNAPENLVVSVGSISFVQISRMGANFCWMKRGWALQVYPNCPAAVRLGIGLCRYKLGQFEKARQAFERVLQLDPENVEALVALAIMDLRTNEATCMGEKIY